MNASHLGAFFWRSTQRYLFSIKIYKSPFDGMSISMWPAFVRLSVQSLFVSVVVFVGRRLLTRTKSFIAILCANISSFRSRAHTHTHTGASRYMVHGTCTRAVHSFTFQSETDEKCDLSCLDSGIKLMHGTYMRRTASKFNFQHLDHIFIDDDIDDDGSTLD